MSDRVYVGPNTADLDYDEKTPKITRVNLAVDSDHIYTSGDDTGRTLECSCPWGTQAMADSILAKAGSVEYRPYEASDVLLDPAAEIGDGVTIGGIYSVLAQSSISFDEQCAANISAPYTDEIDDEYPYKTPEQRKYERQLAYTYSLISKTSEEIRLEVANEIDNLSASIDIQLDSITARIEDAEESIEVTLTTLDGLTVTDSSGTTKIKGSSIETDTLYVNAANITGTLTADQINLTGAIKWSSLSSGMQSIVNDIESTANDAYNMADSAYDMALDTSDIVSDWSYTYGGTTYIDGTMLMTGTVTASSLQGGEVILLGSNGREAASFTLTGATSYSGRKLVVDSGAIEISASYGDVFVSGGDGAYVQLSDEVILGGGDTRPNQNNAWSCGTSSAIWSAVYVYNGVVQTSDRNQKHDIETLPDKYLDMLLDLPVYRFKMDQGTSDRYHVGYIAQDVEEYMAKHGIDSLEFAGFVKDVDADGNEIYMLRYDEFEAIHTLAVQRHESKFAEQAEEMTALKAELQKLMKRLEMAGL